MRFGPGLGPNGTDIMGCFAAVDARSSFYNNNVSHRKCLGLQQQQQQHHQHHSTTVEQCSSELLRLGCVNLLAQLCGKPR